MKHRHSHTTPQNKAKCLAYRNGTRCGRVAKAEVVYYPKHYPRSMPCHLSVCDECKNALIAEYGPEIVGQESVKGFTVRSGGFGPASREYVPIN